MTSETTKMLEEWRNSSFSPIEGMEISRDYLPGDDSSIELIWFIDYEKDGERKSKRYSVKNNADDIDSLNIQIDNVERNELIKIL